MSFRERIIATFEGRHVDKIVWQPRIEKWYEVNRKMDTLPERYKGMSYLEVCDDLNISPRRYFRSVEKKVEDYRSSGRTTDSFNDAIRRIEGEDVKVSIKESEERIQIKYSTPVGELREVRKKTVYGTSYYITEFPVKDVEDMKVMEYILEQQRYEFDYDLFREVEREVGERTLPMISLPHSPLMRLILDYMGFERTVKMLWRQREVTEEFLKAIEENDAKMEKIIRESPFKLVNFGDNVHHDLCSPPLFERYMLPNYQRRTREMRSAGKFCVSHWDGYIGNLLRYIKDTGLNGLECVTPKPQGDVTIEEIHEAIDGLVLMDGLPAILFLPWASDEELREFARKVIELFAPRLILGIGDLLPPNGDIEKVRMVGEIVDEYSS